MPSGSLISVEEIYEALCHFYRQVIKKVHPDVNTDKEKAHRLTVKLNRWKRSVDKQYEEYQRGNNANSPRGY